MKMHNIRKEEPSEELRQPRRNISGSIIMAIIIKTALLTSLSIILLTHSTTPVLKPIDVFAEADDSVDATPAQVYISDDNSDNNDGGGGAAAVSATVNNNDEENETDWDDIEYLRDANNNTMVDYKNLYDLNIGKVYNPNFVDNATLMRLVNQRNLFVLYQVNILLQLLF